jgi:hypothetical protein
MENVHYTVITKKEPQDIVGLVETVQPHLASKPYQHYVFQVVTDHLHNEEAKTTSMINGWSGNIKTLSEDLVERYAYRDIKFQQITVGKNVSIADVFEELAYAIKAAEKASLGEEFVCFTIEALKSNLSKDFMNDFVSNVDLSETRLNDCMSFWNESAKTLSIYNV